MSFMEVLVKGRFRGGCNPAAAQSVGGSARRGRSGAAVAGFWDGRFQEWNQIPQATFFGSNWSLAMSILKWALIFFVVSIIAGILGFTGVSAASADVARVLFYIFVVIFIVLLLLGMTIFRA